MDCKKRWFGGYTVKTKPPEKDKILFISQPLFRDGVNEVDTYDYFCQLFASLNIHLNELNDFDCVTKIVSFERGYQEQNGLIKYCINNPTEYAYVIANLYSREKSIMSIKQLIQTPKCPKLILLDKGYRHKEKVTDKSLWDNDTTKNKYFYDQFNSIGKVVPSYFQVNWELGGKLAANSLFDYVKNCVNTKSIDEGKIIVLNGNDCFERGLAFEKEMLELIKGQSFSVQIEHEYSDFSSLGAQTLVTDLINSINSNSNSPPLIGFFACNDEMALGVRRALMEIEAKDGEFQITPKIVGFDGIKDVTILIDDPREKYIINTVNVKVKEMTDKLCEFLKTNISSTNANWQEKHIEARCFIYRDINKQKKNYDC